jgi:2-keto-4-pentenoate hydratase
MLNQSTIDRAVRALLSAYRDRRAIPSLPADARPATLDEAYRIQAAYAEACGAPVVGYKIGAASRQSQELVGAEGPFLARLFAGTVLPSPAAIAPGMLFNHLVEAELGFRMGGDLPPRADGYRREEVVARIQSAHPVIEICDHRFVDWKAVGLLQLIADNGFYGALVVGPAIADWRDRALADTHAAMSVGGAVRGEGPCGPVLGDPLDGVVWIANELSRQGLALPAGSMIAIGTWTGLHLVAPGEAVQADFGTLGQVRIAFEA